MVNFDKSEVSTRNIRIFEEKILSNEDFDGDKIRSCSVAAEAIYKWIMVVYEYSQITKMDSDVKLNLNEAEDEHATAESNFKSKEKHLEDVRKKRANLIETLEKEKTELDSLEKKENLCFKKKLRAEEFVKILLRKKPQWIEKKALVDETFDTLIGDVLLCATSLTYLTALPCQFRTTKVEAWYSIITDAGIKCRDDFKLWSILMDEIDVQKEHVVGLPEGDFYRENLAMIRCSGRYPILIDPHHVMTKWIKNSNHNLVVIQPECIDYLQRLETAIASDHPVLLENIGQYLDTILYPLLEKRFYKAPNGTFIKLGEASIEYKPDLELYLSTFLENPHFTAEIYDKVTIVNCTLPKCASERMLLKQIMMRDRADLYLEQNQITIQLLDLKKAANEAEMKILSVLSTDHDILEGDDELNVVTMSSMVIDENSKKISEIESRLEAIQSTENEYDSNTKHFSNLLQISMSLRNLCDIYQFSLDWFGNLIGSTIERIEKTGKPEQRCETISELVSKNFFSVSSVALEEMDKLIFAFLVAANSMVMKGILNKSEMEMFYGTLKNSEPMTLIKNMDFFETIADVFEQNKSEWIETIKKGNFPETWTQLNSFQKILLAQSLCPENTVRIITKFVENELGKEYSDFGSFDLNSIFKDSNCGIPIAIVLFDDSEPLKCIFNFAVHMGVDPEKCHIVTLTKASNSIQADLEQSMSSGNWLIIRNLQNCPNWFHDIEKICEDLPSGSAHPDFRFWIVLDHDSFCTTKILVRSQLVAYGASKYVNVESFKKEIGIRLKLVENENTTLNLDLVPNLVAFHEVLRETPIISPWNGSYEFTDTDLLIACREVTTFVNDYENVPSHGLVKFMLECCYGNQIEDWWDSKYVDTLIRSFWKDEIITSVKTGNCIESGLIHSKNLSLMDISKFYNFIEEMLILKRNSDAKKLVYKLLKLQVDYMKDTSTNQDILEKIQEIIDLIPQSLNHESVVTESLENVIKQFITDEVNHFNMITGQTRANLLKLRDGLLGHVFLNDSMEMLWNALKTSNTIPSACLQNIPMKTGSIPVEPFVEAIRAKFTFLEHWMKQGAPEIVDFSLLEYPRTFLCSVLLQHALDSGQSVTNLEFRSEIEGLPPTSNTIYVIGLQIENASWNNTNKTINPEAFQIRHKLPQICFTPSQKYELNFDPRTHYRCPAYKVNTYDDSDDSVVITTVTIPIEKATSTSTSDFEYWTKRRIKIVTNTTR